MTASNSWWKAVADPRPPQQRRRLVLLALLPLALLVSCGGSPSADTGIEPLPDPGRSSPPPPPGPEQAPAATGLTPLPSADQVAAAVPLGRSDPFLPIAVALAGPPAAAPTLPEGFRFSGVIVSGGRVQALVQLGSQSGSLRAGDRGGESGSLLPPGWRVVRIDSEPGRLTLAQGERRLELDL
ncbi:MAG: hypothetical protein VKK98_06050 [Cyanobacteriota bacterium]|nr:hypothetical protein [Cyanobacteriota bacterium]